MPQVMTTQCQKCCDGGSTGSCGNTQPERLSQSWKFREGCSEEGAAELGLECETKVVRRTERKLGALGCSPLHTHVYAHTHTLLYFHI